MNEMWQVAKSAWMLLRHRKSVSNRTPFEKIRSAGRANRRTVPFSRGRLQERETTADLDLCAVDEFPTLAFIMMADFEGDSA